MTAIPKPTRHVEKSYREWIKREFTCLIGSMTCDGPIDPAHMVPAGGAAMGSKVSDRRCIPLCRHHHEIAPNASQMDRLYHIDVELAIAELNREYDRQRVKPKKERTVSPHAYFGVRNCICHKTHKLPLSKVHFAKDGVHFKCPVRNEVVVISK